MAIEALARRYASQNIQKVVGIESRGFILGAPLAFAIGAGFVQIRKKGKLHAETIGHDYELEYGTDRVDIHVDAIERGERVLLIDYLIATGGTMMAGMQLIKKLGGTLVEGAAIVDLPELKGSQLLKDAGLPLFTLVDFEGH